MRDKCSKYDLDTYEHFRRLEMVGAACILGNNGQNRVLQGGLC